MDFDKKDDTFILASGREVYAQGGVLGICMDEGELSISGGWDNGISGYSFTQEERKEIADYCISLWQEWSDYSYPVVSDEQKEADRFSDAEHQRALEESQNERMRERREFFREIFREVVEERRTRNG